MCNDVVTPALKDGYHIIQNGYYTKCSSTVQRFSCNRCDPYKGDIKHSTSKTFWLKYFHNDAKNICDPQGRKMSRRIITQRVVYNKCKCSFFSIEYDSFEFYLAPKVGN